MGLHQIDTAIDGRVASYVRNAALSGNVNTVSNARNAYNVTDHRFANINGGVISAGYANQSQHYGRELESGYIAYLIKIISLIYHSNR